MSDGPRPMLASPMINPVRGADFDVRFAGWALEEKLDGHRCIVQVRGRDVRGFSRPLGSRPPLERALPPHIVEQLRRFPDGDYDGELATNSGKAWDVVRTRERASLVYVIFDLVTGLHDYDTRRAALLKVLRLLPPGQEAISTVLSEPPTWAAVEAIWQRGGEGAILKRRTSLYQPGRRSPDWLKVKQLHAATLTVIGYEAGRSGPYSTIRLRGEDGVLAKVKTLNQYWLRRLAANPEQFLGVALVISYQERTPSGSYRHAMFDHFVE